MRIDAASKLAGILKRSLPDWDFEVVATDKGNATIAATSNDPQSAFLLSSLPPTDSHWHDDVKSAEMIAAENTSLHADKSNVYGKSDNYTFDATVANGRVSIHMYCDCDTARDIARLLGSHP